MAGPYRSRPEQGRLKCIQCSVGVWKCLRSLHPDPNPNTVDKIPGPMDARFLSSVGLGFGTRRGRTQLFPTLALDKIDFPSNKAGNAAAMIHATAISSRSSYPLAIEVAWGGVVPIPNMAAVKSVGVNGMALRFATEEAKSNPEVVMKAVSQNGMALQFASKDLKADRKIVMKAVSQNGMSLRFAPKGLSGDRDVVMKAVSQDGWALQYATAELRNDHEIVMKAVSQDGWALQYATAELKSDHNIVMKAVCQAKAALQYATEELTCDEHIVRAAVANSSRAVGLKVLLLSGRCTHHTFQVYCHMDSVKRRLASLLGLDPVLVAKSGTLLHGTDELSSLSQLDAGALHEITLVISE